MRRNKEDINEAMHKLKSRDREVEHKDLYWFGHPRPTSSPLNSFERFSTNR